MGLLPYCFFWARALEEGSDSFEITAEEGGLEKLIFLRQYSNKKRRLQRHPFTARKHLRPVGGAPSGGIRVRAAGGSALLTGTRFNNKKSPGVRAYSGCGFGRSSA
jgi:hypothetical protein